MTPVHVMDWGHITLTLTQAAKFNFNSHLFRLYVAL